MTPFDTVAPLGRLRREQSGFTLVEIVITLLVIGLVAVSAQPFLQRWKESTDLRTTARKVADAMLLARMGSIVNRRLTTVSVNYTADTLAVTPQVVSMASAGSVDLFFDDSDPDCLSLSGRDVGFQSNGTADAVGYEAVYLKSKSAKVPARYRVKILGATGNVSVERWSGAEWVSAN